MAILLTAVLALACQTSVEDGAVVPANPSLIDGNSSHSDNNRVIVPVDAADPVTNGAPSDGGDLGALHLERTLTIGDVDASDPVKKIERLQPLADYLAGGLGEFGVMKGNVVIAENIGDMATRFNNGTVDIYLDSPYPTLAVQDLADSQVIARRWKKGDPTYWSTYVALKDSGISSPEGFVGRVIALEERNSTSGFILPAGTLVERGFNLTEVDVPDAPVAEDQIGYFLSRDEENTFEMILQGRVAGGGVSNQDYDKLSDEYKDQIIAFDRTITVPRQLVSARSDMDQDLVKAITDLLIELENTPEGRELMDGLKETKRFDLLPPDSKTGLAGLERLITLMPD